MFSLLLHLGLLLALGDAYFSPIPGNKVPLPESLTIRLQQQTTSVAAKAVTATAQAKPNEVRPATNKTRQPSVAVTNRQAVTKKTGPVIETAHTTPADALKSIATAPPVKESDNSAALQQRLKISIQQALAENFRYPLLARKRGWQGEVLISFRIDPDGSILDARIARSSGYGILDSAALSALDKVKRLEHSATHDITMQLPIIYRLEG